MRCPQIKISWKYVAKCAGGFIIVKSITSYLRRSCSAARVTKLAFSNKWLNCLQFGYIWKYYNCELFTDNTNFRFESLNLSRGVNLSWFHSLWKKFVKSMTKELIRYSKMSEMRKNSSKRRIFWRYKNSISNFNILFQYLILIHPSY